jgi:PTH1 family peptidyl-tRNA hydrolase
MRIIVGLGNPGTHYQNTRHNAGFLALDFLAEKNNATFRKEKKFQAEVAEVATDTEKVLLVKPLTFMNCSGEPVRSIMSFYKVDPEHLTVLHDDLDITAGVLKLTDSSRSAGNNGVQSIIDAMGTQDFKRIRIGIGRPTETVGACMPSHDYVLAPFTKEEHEKFEANLPEIQSLLDL